MLAPLLQEYASEGGGFNKFCTGASLPVKLLGIPGVDSVAVSVKESPAQIVPSLFIVPDVSVALIVGFAYSFTVIVAVSKL